MNKKDNLKEQLKSVSTQLITLRSYYNSYIHDNNPVNGCSFEKNVMNNILNKENYISLYPSHSEQFNKVVGFAEKRLIFLKEKAEFIDYALENLLRTYNNFNKIPESDYFMIIKLMKLTAATLDLEINLDN